MAVDEERGSRGKAGRHGLGVAGVELDQDKAMPGRAVSFGFGFQLAQEGFLEFQDVFHLHADDEGLFGGDGGIGEDDILEVVGAGRKDGSALVDLGRIEEVEGGEVLDLENLVHAFNAEAALAVEEIGDVGLFETGLLGEAESSEFPCFDAVPKNFSEIVLQDLELHYAEYSIGL